MKCTSKKSITWLVIGCVSLSSLLSGCGKKQLDATFDYHQTVNNASELDAERNQNLPCFMAEKLCVASKQDILIPKVNNKNTKASAAFNMTTGETLFAYKVHKKLYPASTTKVLTAHLVLKYGNLNDEVVISENAVKLPSGAASGGFAAGDKVKVSTLMYALLISSANDAAFALAEYISGSTEAFATLMNEESTRIGATHSHFVNPNGLHDDNHYTTAYDLYLIFNEACKNPKFEKMIHKKTKTVKWNRANGAEITKTLKSTNQFLTGEHKRPNGYRIIGGKTGTTYDAGNCLLVLTTNSQKERILFVALGCNSREHLYDYLFSLMKAVKKI